MTLRPQIHRSHAEIEYLHTRLAWMLWWLRRHPVHAVWLVCGVTLTPHQRIAFRAAWETPNCVWLLSRGMAKTFLGGAFCVMVNLLYRLATGVVVAPSFRQGKLVVEREMGSMIDERLDGQERRGYARRCVATTRTVQRLPDLFSVKFQHDSLTSTGPLGMKGEASPLRGLRANSVLLLDEAADLDAEVRTSVIRPFTRVLRGFGAATARAIFPFRYVQAGTIRYKWQAYAKDVAEYRERMAQGSMEHIVVEFNYEDAFYYERNDPAFPISYTYSINLRDVFEERDSANTDMDTFLAENKNVEMSEAGVEFPQVLIESCRRMLLGVTEAGDEIFPEPVKAAEAPVVIGVDVARSSADTAIVVVSVGADQVPPVAHNQVLYARVLTNTPYHEQAEAVHETLRRFPGARQVVIDRGGGGTALRDELWFPRDETVMPLYDPADANTPREIVEHGRPMLRLDDATDELNTLRANFVKAQMQTRRLALVRHEYAHRDPELRELYRVIYLLGQQFTWIQSSPTARGYKHYTTRSQKLKKDLFSATLLAMGHVWERQRRTEDPQKAVVHYGRWIRMRG